MTRSFEEEVKNPENNIYLLDNLVALHDNWMPLLKQLPAMDSLPRNFAPSLLCLSRCFHHLLRNSTSGLV